MHPYPTDSQASSRGQSLAQAMSSLYFSICQYDPGSHKSLSRLSNTMVKPGVHLIKQLAHQLHAKDVGALQICLRRLAMPLFAMPCPA